MKCETEGQYLVFNEAFPSKCYHCNRLKRGTEVDNGLLQSVDVFCLQFAGAIDLKFSQQT